MKIAFVTTEYITEHNFDGGLANYIHRTSLSLIELGHQPIVVVPSKKNESFVYKGIEIHRVYGATVPWIKLLNAITLRRFSMFLYLVRLSLILNTKVKQLNMQDPLSVIHYTHLGGVALFRLNKVPSIIRLSSYTPLSEAYEEYDNHRSFQIRLQALLERWALKRADAVFGPSKVIAKKVEEEINVGVEVIESPFILDTTATDDTVYRDLLTSKNYLLFFGRFSIAKGVLTIADVIPKLLTKYPKLFFIFIGKEHIGYKGKTVMDYIWEKAESHRGRVLYLGNMRHEQLYPILSHALAVVLPSLIDNFPNACLEAMAHKRVVIGTRGASFEQLIVDGESGFLCKVGDPISLLEAIEKALNLTDEERRQMGQKALKRIDELHPEKVGRKLIDLYSRVMKKY